MMDPARTESSAPSPARRLSVASECHPMFGCRSPSPRLTVPSSAIFFMISKVCRGARRYYRRICVPPRFVRHTPALRTDKGPFQFPFLLFFFCVSRGQALGVGRDRDRSLQIEAHLGQKISLLDFLLFPGLARLSQFFVPCPYQLLINPMILLSPPGFLPPRETAGRPFAPAALFLSFPVKNVLPPLQFLFSPLTPQKDPEIRRLPPLTIKSSHDTDFPDPPGRAFPFRTLSSRRAWLFPRVQFDPAPALRQLPPPVSHPCQKRLIKHTPPATPWYQFFFLSLRQFCLLRSKRIPLNRCSQLRTDPWSTLQSPRIFPPNVVVISASQCIVNPTPSSALT